MSDQCEEQELEAEALTAIFDTAFEIIKGDEQPFEWSITLYPEPCEDPDENNDLNHVGIKLLVKVPLDYPEISLPILSIELVKGLAPHHKDELLEISNQEANDNMGLPSIYAICEKLREWLVDHNTTGLDDLSMYAQMLRTQKEAEKSKEKQNLQFESQKEEQEFTQAELEELAVRKRRAEGTPCTAENFYKWIEKFDAEMKEKELNEKLKEEQSRGSKRADKKGGGSTEDKSSRLTGKQQFSGNADNLKALEDAIAEKIEEANEDTVVLDEGEALVNVNEDLFEDDDEDLDDLDFDDDDDDEEPDI